MENRVQVPALQHAEAADEITNLMIDWLLIHECLKLSVQQ